MRPLIDADVLRYEIGSIGDIDGPKSFDFIAAILDGRIQDICKAAGGTVAPTLYLTGKGNFRDAVAVTKPYKGNRLDKDGNPKQAKPFHFENITVYMHNQYDVEVAEGMEADDLMSIEQMACPANTVICTRDKDLRMIPGHHYGWECGAQREFGPMIVTQRGNLSIDRKKKSPKLTGTGMMFFWAQMLIGDTADNIPGCPGIGDVKAWDILMNEADPRSMWERVRDTYYSKKRDDDMILEQGQLLWMVRELHEDGSPVMWELPDGDES